MCKENSKKKWTEEEDQYLKGYYPFAPYHEMKKVLNRTKSAIQSRAFEVKVKRVRGKDKNQTKKKVD